MHPSAFSHILTLRDSRFYEDVTVNVGVDGDVDKIPLNGMVRGLKRGITSNSKVDSRMVGNRRASSFEVAK